jgi:DNA-directed RNA polymerase subunit delta
MLPILNRATYKA